MDKFKALVLNQEGENFNREVKTIDKSFLKHGNVTVKVDYSGLNFKDALILKNGARLVKEFPHIPGIDFSGTVVESDSDKFKEGDEVNLPSNPFELVEMIRRANSMNDATKPSDAIDEAIKSFDMINTKESL